MAETKALVFDLDDTLAPSKQPIPIEIANQHITVGHVFGCRAALSITDRIGSG